MRGAIRTIGPIAAIEPVICRRAGRRVACAAALLAASSLAVAQVQTPDRSRSSESSAGAPDFSGTWERYTPPRDANAQPPRDPNASPPSPPPGGTPGAGLGPAFGGTPPPLKPEYMADYEADVKMRQDAERRGEPIPSANAQCIPEGMPGMMIALFPMEVLQTRGQITIVQEAFNQVRRIYIGEEPPAIDDAEPSFFGHSGAKWEGDTLVVETVGIKESVRYRNAPHSSEMRIRERMRMLDANRFEDQITVTDPVYLSGPWSWTWTYQRKPGYKMYEYVCEDNREFADPDTGAQRMRFKSVSPE
jgi:hypothetical protein